MNLIPYHTETLVSALSKEEVLGQLMRVTREVNFLDARTWTDEKIKFNGMIENEGFRISKSIKKGETFLPLVIGKVEGTPRGSIIFLRYRLFPSALFFLIFWTLVLLGFALYYFFAVNNLINSLFCVLLGLLNYGLGLLFFHRQLKISRQVFHELINYQMKGNY